MQIFENVQCSWCLFARHMISTVFLPSHLLLLLFILIIADFREKTDLSLLAYTFVTIVRYISIYLNSRCFRPVYFLTRVSPRAIVFFNRSFIYCNISSIQGQIANSHTYLCPISRSFDFFVFSRSTLSHNAIIKVRIH